MVPLVSRRGAPINGGAGEAVQSAVPSSPSIPAQQQQFDRGGEGGGSNRDGSISTLCKQENNNYYCYQIITNNESFTSIQ